MDCVNHPGVSATAYCQNCGKPLCTDCIASGVLRPAARGMILCGNCIDAWQASNPYVPPPLYPPGSPRPSLAAVLGLIPGVGAMYNGQFFKGLIHVVIFAVLVSMADRYPIFGIFIAAWILYQSFEAYQTARARLEGQPPPDPLGLNELGNWMNLGSRPQPPPAAGTSTGSADAAGNAAAPGAGPGFAQQGFVGANPGWQAPYAPPGYPPSPYGPPPPGVPPGPPLHYCGRRREPVGAMVLIALGLFFLLGQMDGFAGRIFDYMWPVLLIGLGVWLIARRLARTRGNPTSTQGGPK